MTLFFVCNKSQASVYLFLIKFGKIRENIFLGHAV